MIQYSCYFVQYQSYSRQSAILVDRMESDRKG